MSWAPVIRSVIRRALSRSDPTNLNDTLESSPPPMSTITENEKYGEAVEVLFRKALTSYWEVSS